MLALSKAALHFTSPCGRVAGRDLGLAVWAMSWVSHSASPGLSLLLSATLSELGQDHLTRLAQLSILTSMLTLALKCNKKTEIWLPQGGQLCG